ncbi:hypothetical protein IWW45_002869 [Coemansia sp. RSA 485]|nr:hypothetical protein IWW45_002869 [Coemansia sp. RSA 485]
MLLFSKQSGISAKPRSLVRISGQESAFYSVAVGVSVIALPQGTADVGKSQTEVYTDTEEMTAPQSGYLAKELDVELADNPAQSVQEMSHSDPEFAAASVSLATPEAIASGHTVFFGSLQNRSSDQHAQQKSAHLSPEDLASGTVNLSFRNLSQVLSGIALYAQSIRSLVLSNNALSQLPDAIGHLHRLQTLDVTNNKLHELPAAIAHCQRLEIVYAGSNRLSDLPSSIRHLRQLAKLDLRDNKLASVPACLWTLPRLESLDLSNNQIERLPSRMFVQGGIAALNKERPLKLVVDGCPLELGSVESSQPASQPTSLPSLVETILCRMVNSNAEYPLDLPEHLCARLETLVACDHCHRLYPIDKGVKRHRILFRNKVALPVEYNLCLPHWDTDDQRIASLFAPRSPESAQPYYQFKKAALQSVSTRVACSSRSGGNRRGIKALVSSITHKHMGGTGHRYLAGLESVRCRLKKLLLRSKQHRPDAQPTPLSQLSLDQQGHRLCLAEAYQEQSCTTLKRAVSDGGKSHRRTSQSRVDDIRLWQYFENDVPELSGIAKS